jgi:hypothetical protein
MEVHPSMVSTIPNRDANQLYKYLENSGFFVEFPSAKYLAKLEMVGKRKIHHVEVLHNKFNPTQE